MNLKRLISLVALFAATVAMAQESVPASDGFGLLLVPRDAARAAMAGAGYASLTGSQAFAAFGNPATVPLAPSRFHVGASYAHWAPGLQVSLSNNVAAGASACFGRFGLSLGGVYQMHPELDFGPDGLYAPKDRMLALGIGFRILDNLSVGLAWQTGKQQMPADYAVNISALTAMALYRIGSLNLAAGVANLGVAYDYSDYISPSAPPQLHLPTSARIAADYSLHLGPGAMEVSLDGDYFFSGKLSVAGGLCYSFRQMLFARAGYRYASTGAALPSYLSLGAGARYKMLQLDLTWLTASEALGNTLMVGLGIDF